MHRESAASSQFGDSRLRQERLDLVQECVSVLRTLLNYLGRGHPTSLLLQLRLVVLAVRDLSKQVELVRDLPPVPAHGPPVLVLLLHGPASLSSLVQHDGPLLAHLPQVPPHLQRLRQGHVVALGRDASGARDAVAVLAVDCAELVVHDDRVRLLQLGEPSLVRCSRLATNLLWMHKQGHLVIGLSNSLGVEAVHVQVEHLEEVCAVLQALHLPRHRPAVFRGGGDGDGHEHVEVVLRRLAHLRQGVHGLATFAAAVRLPSRRRRGRPLRHPHRRRRGCPAQAPRLPQGLHAAGRRAARRRHHRRQPGRRCHGGRR
mmetsp:Transcript_86104/g.251928  ORF Transcript_86104/g.251928 Transcript_86104/m.251928 type:complete len:316 (+) Transcript_86104:1257-2204(+)